MQIHCCQFDIAWEDKPANHRKVAAMLDAARPAAGALVLLPEMFSTGFSMNISATRDDLSNADRTFLADLARRHSVYLVGGLVTAGPEGKGRNQAAVFDPSGREIARYTKLHCFSPGRETNHYLPGDRIVSFDWSGMTVAPFICYDLRFPEAFRAGARAGAQVLAVIANWPAARAEHWVTLLMSRAIENQAYVAAVNRCGSDPALEYRGRSLIVSPRGAVLADAGAGEQVIAADIDRQQVAQWRREFDALADIRPDLLPPAQGSPA